jgi:hypothetical protein
LPIRYCIAWKTGEACGLTATRSSGLSAEKYSAVMIDTIEADEAWCPPTLIPSTLGRMIVGIVASSSATESHKQPLFDQKPDLRTSEDDTVGALIASAVTSAM